MASDILNLTENIGNLSIEPIYDTNWCHMPAEIKLKCIGTMKFRERWSLRCTAKAERSLVDSQKIKYIEGCFWGNNTDVAFDLYRDNRDNYDFSLIPRDTDDGLYSAKKVEFEWCDVNDIIAVLRKLKNGVESVKINAHREISTEFAKILAIPHVQNLPYWQIKYYEKNDSLHKVAQMWIDKNSNIGSTFQIDPYEEGSFEEFLNYFTDRIVSKNERRVRIRTNNPDRHILLERGIDEIVGIVYNAQYFRLMVISAEMKESEYDDNCKEWICKMNSQYYDSDSSESSSDDLNDFYGYDDDYEDY